MALSPNARVKPAACMRPASTACPVSGTATRILMVADHIGRMLVEIAGADFEQMIVLAHVVPIFGGKAVLRAACVEKAETFFDVAGIKPHGKFVVLRDHAIGA